MKNKHSTQLKTAFLLALSLGAAPFPQSLAANTTSTTEFKIPETAQFNVRGCTVDGKIYQMGYSFDYNPEDVAKIFNKTVTIDETTPLKTKGSDFFISFLNNVKLDIVSGISENIGNLIDTSTEHFIKTHPDFSKKLDEAITQIESDVEETQNLRVKITAKEIKKQGGKCAPAN